MNQFQRSILSTNDSQRNFHFFKKYSYFFTNNQQEKFHYSLLNFSTNSSLIKILNYFSIISKKDSILNDQIFYATLYIFIIIFLSLFFSIFNRFFINFTSQISPAPEKYSCNIIFKLNVSNAVSNLILKIRYIEQVNGSDFRNKRKELILNFHNIQGLNFFLLCQIIQMQNI